jgi:hypothetical protein
MIWCTSTRDGQSVEQPQIQREIRIENVISCMGSYFSMPSKCETCKH